MPKWRMWGGVLAVFVCGLVIGAVAGSLYERRAAISHIERIRSDRGASIAQMTLDRLRRELDLSAEQAETLKPILDDGFQRGHQLLENLRPQLDRLLQEITVQVKERLSQEQTRQLEQMGGWRMLMPPPPGRPGPPPPGPRPGSGGPPPWSGGPPPRP